MAAGQTIASIGSEVGHPRADLTVTVAAPVLLRIRGSSHPISLVGLAPATATLVVAYTLSSWDEMDAGTAVWVDSAITFTPGTTPIGGQIGFPVNGLRATATTLTCTLQAQV